METRYIEDNDFVEFINSFPFGERELIVVEGKYRWQITEKDGTKYIIRPEGSKKI